MGSTSEISDLVGSLESLSIEETTYREFSSNATTFLHKFNEVPVELRLLIWDAMLPGPRTIEFQLKELSSTKHEGSYTISSRPIQALWTAHKPPQTLLVCKESDGVFSKHFTHEFHGSSRSIPKGYFDFQRNTFFLNYEIFTTPDQTVLQALRGLSTADDLARVKSLAVAISGPIQNRIPRRDHAKEIADLISIFHEVEYLTTVAELWCRCASHRKTEGSPSE